ncbi:flagellar protein FlaG [Legionella maioricensis]|uniref:Flagellar protein FlaG n=1 Tax=Legionella maioricensis TaxID=2896528 RepID=A0A9X2IBP7_9GAMM|nr:flagellar protein FlaG [Legionella maioricensis]MCL9684635.1 flagellar protein FlaG [Legionella maioricensis]MCL9687415.1 flagellar protein FlaG [Legionella maioricensis]
MNIDPLKPISPIIKNDTVKLPEKTSQPVNKTSSAGSLADSDMKYTLDEATGLLQAIVTDKITDKVIRKMPSDEYLHLLSLLDEIINGSIDKHI